MKFIAGKKTRNLCFKQNFKQIFKFKSNVLNKIEMMFSEAGNAQNQNLLPRASRSKYIALRVLRFSE